ncbi:MAG: aspartate aminotransferase family protein [Armatimonadetes bacterium]|nr:aspartate aminotransferase family protein [Armatimonadota bacterium]
MPPSAEQVIAWDQQNILQTYARLPVVMERGEGALLWDVNDKRYIDLESGGRAGNALGHAHPKIAQALADQARKLLYLSNDFYNPHAAKLAHELAATTNCTRVFFQNSGAEANECAIKLARKYAKREHGASCVEIVTAVNSFHGRTLGALTATGQPKYQEGYEPLPGGFTYVPFNDVAALEAAVGLQTAALMFEPILGESGCYPATKEFLQAARRICDERDIPLLLDEVQTGYGRTGKFWAYEHYGIEPDVVTLAKAMGGGLPMGACFATEAVASAFAPGDHGCTFGGNPASAATALAALEVMREESLVEESARKGDRLLSLLEEMDRRHGLFSEIRGEGLMVGVDLKEPLAREVMLAALDAGLVISASGPHTLRLLPALVIPDALLEEAVSILETVILQQVQQAPQKGAH